ncbi:beta-lactamase [Bacillus cereus VD200]|nr:class A beta-lactamase [Bacillus cereus]EJR91131.1 beta-lactamase [Bacillus cereus VD200]
MVQKNKKELDWLKPVNVVTTAAILATTLFTPIVDVLPGKYNIVHAAETQSPAKYGVIDTSNNWKGIYSDHIWPHVTENMGTYNRYRLGTPTNGMTTNMVNFKIDYPLVAVEAKLRSNADRYIEFHWARYDFVKGTWGLQDSTAFISPDAPKPKVGEWGIWKVTYDQTTKKNTYYLNGKMVGYRNYQDGTLGNANYLFRAEGFEKSYVDVESIYTSNSATNFVLAPKVNGVTDVQTKLTGSGSPGAAVTIESNVMPGKYTGTVDGNGNFSIDIPKQKAGTELTVTQALDGSTSEKTVVTVKDGTAPDAPKVNPVTSQDTKITGTGEKGAKATVKIGNGEYEGTVDEKGNYAIDIPEQPVGTELSVTLTDAAGNTSQPTKINVGEKDTTAPDAPKVNKVTDQDTKVTGTGEKGSKVSVVVDGKEIGMGKVDDQGNYTVDIPKQAGGKEIVVTLTDAAGNTSQPTKTKVETKDVTAPDAPKVNPVTDQDTKVTGMGEKGATVKVVVDGKEIGTGKVDDQGNYTVDIPKQPVGKEVVVTLIDTAGNTSQPTVTKVKIDSATQEKAVKEAKYAIDHLFTNSSRSKFNHDFTTVKKGAIQIHVTEQHIAEAMEKLRKIPDDYKEKPAFQKEIERAQSLVEDREKMQEGNLVQNGLFDSGLNKWKPWLGTGATTPTVKTDDDKSKNVIKLDPNSSVEQVLTGLEPNTTYELTAYARAEDNEKFSVGTKKTGTANVTVPIYSKEYSQAHLTFKTGPNSTTATIYLYKNGGTKSGYADFVITKKVMGETEQTHQKFSQLEKEFDAKLGIYALDTSTNQTVIYNPNERFAYASTHKALAVGVLLQKKSIEDLDQRIMYTDKDLVNYNPITEKHIDRGMTLKELADASLRYSDNTAQNLIFKQIGGPDGFKKALQEIGDTVTNPQRIEPELNDVNPGETPDTSTPKALAASLQTFILGDVLPTEKRNLLIDWMKRNTTGDKLIRAGVPKGWEVADKTGAASYGTRNDIAVIWPPNKKPIVLAILSNRDKKEAKYNDQLIAEATKIALDSLKINNK